MNLLLFIITIAISFVIVRIGAVAFQLTGLDWSVAKFQSLSCFSGTGFTTRESEMIVTHPQRRKIATYLMVLGNAGLVTIIATFANSIRPDALLTRVLIPGVSKAFPPVVAVVLNIVILCLSVFLIVRIFSSNRIMHGITTNIRRRMLKRETMRTVTFDELYIMSGGYGVTQARVNRHSPLVGKTLRESPLRENDILVLAISRDEKMITEPAADREILAGDNLICFGKLNAIQREIGRIKEL